MRDPRFPRFLRCLLAGTLGLLALSTPTPALAQDPAKPPATTTTPPAAAPSVRITFLPPPLEGTLSVGVYDRSGKFVRTLHREAGPSDFTVGLNGFITAWDGKDQSGNPVPPGKYRVKGLAVGDIELTGEAFHGNDWVISEDGPHPVSFHRISIQENELTLEGIDSAQRRWKFIHSLASGSLRVEPASTEQNAPTPSLQTPPPPAEPTQCPGRDGSRWSIEKVLGEPVVIQTDTSGEVMRRLSIGAGEPSPVALAASLERDEIFLLESDSGRWRLRGLRRKPPAPGSPSSPAWETFMERNRFPCNTFADSAKRVGRSKPFQPQPKISTKTQPNPLLSNTASSIELAVTVDPEGSVLSCADGLPLRRLTDSVRLRWAVLGYDPHQPQLVLLQSDGAVIEEYRMRNPGNLMTFDAGEYLWPPR
ncbi:MAG: FlgD Ig-like domain [Verrucomicrobiota bacterium]